MLRTAKVHSAAATLTRSHRSLLRAGLGRRDRVGGGLQLGEFCGEVAPLDQLGIALRHLEQGLVALPPETDVDLVLAYAEVARGQVRQPFRQRRVDGQAIARRIRRGQAVERPAGSACSSPMPW
jgi:hypothetical protein